MLLAVVVLVLALGWIGFRAVQVDRNLLAARTALSAAEGPLRNGGQVPAATLRSAADHTRTARTAVRDPLWVIAAHIPWLGRPLRTAAGIAEVGDRITHESVPTLLGVTDKLEQVKSADALHGLPMPAMQSAATGLSAVDTQLQSDVYAVAHLPGGGVVAPVTRARTELLGQLGRMSAQVHSAAVATSVGLPMLGASGARRYLVIFENPAEARPDMGLVGGFAELIASNGHLHVAKIGSNGELPAVRLPSGAGAPVVTVGYRQLGAGVTWVSSNLSPDFAANGSLLAAMYATSAGRTIDGVIALDPTAMGAILTQAGRDVTVPVAGRIAAGDVASFLESGQYSLPLDEGQRKSLLTNVGRQTVDVLLAGHVSTINLGRALGHLAGSGHLRLFSVRQEEQTQLATFPIAGVLPETDRPFVGAYVTNAAGTKLDYYLDETLSYRTESCGSGSASGSVRATVTVTLTNNVPARGVPSFVTRGSTRSAESLPAGANRVLLSVVVSPGAKVSGASFAGRPVSWDLQSVERGNHPLYLVSVELPARLAETLTLTLDAPHVRGRPLLAAQPLPRAPLLQTTGPVCSVR